MPIEVTQPVATTGGHANQSAGPARNEMHGTSILRPPPAAEPQQPAPVAQEPPAKEESQATKPPAPEEDLWEVQVKGKTVKMTREQAKAELAKRVAAEEAFREAAKLKKEAEEAAKKPWWERVDGATDEERLAKLEEHLWEKKYKAEAERQAKLAQYPEEARPLAEKLLEAEQRAAALEAAQKAEAETKAQAERKATIEKYKAEAMDFYGEMAVKALETAKVPGGSTTAAKLVPRLAERLIEAKEAGLQLAPEVLAEDVKRELQEETALVYGGLEGPALLDAMGDDWTLRVVRAYVAKKKASGQGAAPPAPQQRAPSGLPRGPDGKFLPQDTNRVDMDEWRLSYAERKARGLI